jgi:thiol-disulfide isomerase/thioredoxin
MSWADAALTDPCGLHRGTDSGERRRYLVKHSIATLDVEGFDGAIAEVDPTLVLFTAPWCTNCRRVAPEASALAADNPWSLRVRQVVVDDAPDLAERFEIRSIPAALLFRGGELVQRIHPREAGELVAAVESGLEVA